MRANILLAFIAFKASEAICPNGPCFSWNSPLPPLDPSASLALPFPSPQPDANCLLAKLSSQPELSPGHPLLEKLTRTFGFPAADHPVKTVPIVENHVGHKIVKVIRHVPVLVKVTKPELVVRTHHVPVLKHVPVTEKCIRNVERPVIRKFPVVHKTIRPYTYQTVRHVPVPVNPCCPSQLLSQGITGLPLKPKFIKPIQTEPCLSDIITLPSAPLCGA